MNGQRSSEYLEGLLRELCALPHETEWVEFKEEIFAFLGLSSHPVIDG